ncbi:hypothetical protein [Pararobbsia alpina]|uniref:Uncharacterized protein n=1 Tax=Pararobbsia alpina TaxID=621374 RepID=A0A6S7C3Q6_9BURK|nr:hypothetical protein [Pararobbsia alpina]CAB3800654.1 hypothetical protein LMG28138_04879 [Pararobbsia alpina]
MTSRSMTEWFYTAPLDAFAIRRGDPLGMRAIAEDMADQLAPGLSNRTMDGRWISIVCWAVGQGYEAWRALNGHASADSIALPKAADEVYSWIRPLEALWIARTVYLTEDAGRGRQLPGLQAARRWLDHDESKDRFGFSESSYERYRFTGAYGGYRVLLRSLPGLTVGGDGWRLDKVGQTLAHSVQERVRCTTVHRGKKGPRPRPEDYWLRHFDWSDGELDGLPTVLADDTKLPAEERQYLKEALFSTSDAAGLRRLNVLMAASTSRASSRDEMFADIAKALGSGKPLAEIALLSAFSSLADAGVRAMNACWAVVNKGDMNGTGFVRVGNLLGQEGVESALDQLVHAATRWKKESAFSNTYAVADALAESILAPRGKRREQLFALIGHHAVYGGGLLWLAIENDAVKPLAPLRGGQTSEYRYRIGALCRLGVQCGLIPELPVALRALNELDTEEDVV